METIAMLIGGMVVGWALVTAGLWLGRRTPDPCPRSKVGHGWRTLQVRGRRFCPACGVIDDFGVRYQSWSEMIAAERAERKRMDEMFPRPALPKGGSGAV